MDQWITTQHEISGVGAVWKYGRDGPGGRFVLVSDQSYRVACTSTLLHGHKSLSLFDYDGLGLPDFYRGIAFAGL
jgi:hypothetical protein